MTHSLQTRLRRSRKILTIIRSLRWAFLFFGVLALGYCSYVFLSARYFQARERAQFTNLASAPSSPMPTLPLPLPVRFAPGSPIAELDIPSLSMRDVVIQGVSAADLRIAVGHIPGTALPWQNGNVVLSAHRTTFFRPLRKIRSGDLIALRTRYGSYWYRVRFTQIVKPTDVQVLAPHSYASLTLTTCYPFYYIGSAPDRFIVVAARTAPQSPRT